MNYKWAFASSGGTGREGISDSGIETFRGNPIMALAREICQNSLDAGVADKTVKIEFSLDYIKRNEFPDADNFRIILQKCKNAWSKGNYIKTIDFIDEAIQIIDSNEIPVLRISDFNTTGLRGSNETSDTDWFNLVKAKGVSSKDGFSGGSYGIGKFATFACSSLRTVIYSTLDINGYKATQGVTKLVSFNLSDSEDNPNDSLSTGFYGVDNMMPIRDCLSFSKDFHRTEPGTDIYVAGYKSEFIKEWDAVIIKEILDNYFYAIYKGTLEVIVNGVKVNNSTLLEISQQYSKRLSETTKEYINLLYNSKTHWFHEDYLGSGEVSLGILILEENAPGKVAMIRKPWMKIKDQDKISDFIPFVGVLVIEDNNLNTFLRKAENPQHNKWESSLVTNKKDKELVSKLISGFRPFISEKLRSLVSQDNVEKLEIQGASEFIPLQEDEEDGSKANIETLTPVTKVREIKKKATVKTTIKNDVYGDLEVEEISDGKYDGTENVVQIPDHGNGSNSGGINKGDVEVGTEDGDQKIRKLTLVGTQELKFLCINKKENLYRLFIKPQFSADNCHVKIYQLDEQGEKSSINIIEAKRNNANLIYSLNKIEIGSITKDIIESLDFKVDKKDYFSVEVEIYGNQK